MSALVVYRIGAHVPIPGLDPALFRYLPGLSGNSWGTFGMMFAQPIYPITWFSIFSLGVYPYLVAAVIGRIIFPRQIRLGTIGPRINGRQIFVVSLTTLIALGMGYGKALALTGTIVNGQPLVLERGWSFEATNALVLAAGALCLVWLGNKITRKGLGNGIALLLATDVLIDLSGGARGAVDMVIHGTLPAFFIVLLVVIAPAIVWVVVGIELAERRISIRYPALGEIRGTVPFKINNAGVVPPLFAMQVLLLPLYVSSWMPSPPSDWFIFLPAFLGRGHFPFYFLYSALIVFSTFWYSRLVVGPEHFVEHVNARAGELSERDALHDQTLYMTAILKRLNWIAAAYLVFISILPELLIANYHVPIYFGGAVLLIVVCVTLDTIQDIRSRIAVASVPSR